MSALIRTKTGYRARKGIPKDVRTEYQRLFGPEWEAKLTLPAGLPLPEAKAKFSEWLSEIETRVETIRARQRGEAQGLTHKQARALAGEWYQQFIARHEERPGDPEGWAVAFDYLIEELKDWLPELRERTSINLGQVLQDEDVRVGIRPFIADWAHTAQFLASKGVALTNEARDLFLDFVASDYLEAVLLLERRAKGDYSPDDRPRQFPLFSRPGTAQGQGVSPWALFEQWVKEAQPAGATVTRWRSVFLALEARFKSADEITADTAHEWVRSLVNGERSARTVSGTWLSAANRIFKFAVEQKLVASNPFAKVKVTVPKKTQTREKTFTDQEAKMILGAALGIKAKGDAFKRWVPWICAYSGARAGEITQLRGVDIGQQGDFHTMKLSPEAGTIKTRTARTIPIHEHLIAQGFLDFVTARGKGPLFYNPEDKTTAASDPTNPRRPPAVKRRDRLAVWVRTLGVDDPEISPNHAWRHTFKQIAERHGITERVSDAITGHAPATVGRGYGAPNVEDMARELGKFPRYNI
jgi:integrase